MKYNEIIRKFNDKVMEYMMAGYVINPKSMRGSQGEEGKVDLIKGDELIRVWLESESHYRFNDMSAWNGSILVLSVGRWIHPASHSKTETVWYSDVEVIHQEFFYEISRDKWYLEDESEAIATQRVRRRRWSNHSPKANVIDMTDLARDLACKYLKRKHGYKRLQWSDILVTKHISTITGEIDYHVVYKGHQYRLK